MLALLLFLCYVVQHNIYLNIHMLNSVCETLLDKLSQMHIINDAKTKFING